MTLRPKNLSMHPPGGIKHKEKTSGMEFQDTSWEQMKAKVYRHRIAKVNEQGSEEGYDIAAGWIDRLMHDLCIQNPQVEADVVDENGQQVERWLGLNDIARFQRTVAKFVADGMQWVAPEKGIERLKSCTSGDEGGRKCRWHGKVNGCWGCAKIVDVAATFAGMPDIGPKESSIMSCTLCGCDCKIKALMPLEVANDKSIEWPAWCWISKEQKAIDEANA